MNSYYYFRSKCSRKQSFTTRTHLLIAAAAQITKSTKTHKSFYHLFMPSRLDICQKVFLPIDARRSNTTLRQFKQQNSYIVETCSLLQLSYKFIVCRCLSDFNSFIFPTSCCGESKDFSFTLKSFWHRQQKSFNSCELKCQEEIRK